MLIVGRELLVSNIGDSNDSLAQEMPRMMDQMLQVRDNIAGLDMAIDRPKRPRVAIGKQ